MRKIILISFIFFIATFRKINASNNRLVNEINNISINAKNQSLEISGWAFLHNAQNYYNANTHEYTLTLRSQDDLITVKGVNTNISHTDTMLFYGAPYCRDNQFNLEASVCNNYYNNVGFKFSVPLSKFKMDQNYVASLNVNAKTAKLSKSSEVYFSNKDTLTLSTKHEHYIVDSKLLNTGVRILNSKVLVRQSPAKNGVIVQNNLSCSNTRNTFYRKGSYFKSIFDKRLVANTTYYQLKGKLDGCTERNAVIKEGNDIYPIWIASNFIEHVGQSLTIKTRLINTPPSIRVRRDAVLYVDEKLDIMEGVSASDKEDGDLTSKIKIIENTYENKPGNYHIKYEVSDSLNIKAYAIKNISVLRRNYPPVINANNKIIYQYSNYNPYDGVNAYDQDGTNINDKLSVASEVNTSKLGKYNECFKVVDKYNLSTTKCIIVEVIKPKTSFRFIQKSRVFYKENIPLIWKDNYTNLLNELENDIVYQSKTITK